MALDYSFEVEEGNIVGTLRTWAKNLKALFTILLPDWTDWIVKVTPTAGTWVPGNRLSQYLYVPILGLMFFRIRVEGTTDTLQTELRTNLPKDLRPHKGSYIGALTIDSFSAWIADTTGQFGGFSWIREDQGYLAVRKADSSDIAVGETTVVINGFYRTR